MWSSGGDRSSTDVAPTGASGEADAVDRDRSRVPSWLSTTTSYAWRMLVVVAATYILVLALAELAIVTVPVVLALILATLAAPPTRWLVGKGTPPALAALLVVVGGLLAFFGILAAIAPVFVAQAQELGPTIVQGFEDLLVWLEEGPLGIDAAQIDQWIQQGLDALQEQGGELASGVAGALATTVEVITALVLMVILLFFFAKDGPNIVSWVLDLVPSEQRDHVAAASSRAWEALAGYVRGTALVATVDAVGIGLGLLILGVPLALPLAVLVFFGGFIPVVGATVTGLLAVLVALADGGLAVALIVLGIVIVVQQVESDILQPVIMRRAVRLHPVVVLLVLAAGARLVGIIGAFLAVPVTASLAAIGNELRLRRRHPRNLDERPLGGPKGRLTDADGNLAAGKDTEEDDEVGGSTAVDEQER